MEKNSHVRPPRGAIRWTLLIAGAAMFLGCQTAPPVRERITETQAAQRQSDNGGPLEVEWGGVPSSWNNNTTPPP